MAIRNQCSASCLGFYLYKVLYLTDYYITEEILLRSGYHTDCCLLGEMDFFYRHADTALFPAELIVLLQ